MTPAHEVEKEDLMTSVAESASALHGRATDGGVKLEDKISEALNSRGYSDISEVYAYYTAEEKAAHGRHCERWTEFGHRPETAPYRTGKEREFIAQVEAENPGKFASYLISWSGSD